MSDQKQEDEKKEEIQELTPDAIMGMDPQARAAMCGEAVNSVLKDFNCIFNPLAVLTNNGCNIQVKVIPLAYPVVPEVIPPNLIN